MRGAALAPWSCLLAGALACSVPVGMYGHDPRALWSAPITDAPGPLPPARYAGVPIVMKRFQNLARVPVGAHFVLDREAKGGSSEAGKEVEADSIAQGYAPSTDLSLAVFESVYLCLSTAGYPVWKDYRPSETLLQGPPGAEAFVVLVGTVSELEVDTFAADRLYEAARLVLDLRLVDAAGAELGSWRVEKIARLARGQSDLLQLTGELVADEIAQRIERLPSLPTAAKAGAEPS
jgi:hypothetical protein